MRGKSLYAHFAGSERSERSEEASLVGESPRFVYAKPRLKGEAEKPVGHLIFFDQYVKIWPAAQGLQLAARTEPHVGRSGFTRGSPW